MPDTTKASTPAPQEPEHWRELAEKASKEQDPKKLLQEVEELCEELERRQAKLHKDPTDKT